MDRRAPRPDSTTLAGMDDQELLEIVKDPVQAKVSFYEDPETFRRGFGAVLEPAGLVWAAWWCQSEIRNGGFHQFFGNQAGMLAPEAERGFDLILVPRAASLIRKATSLLPSPYPRDREARGKALEAIMREGRSRKEWDPFYEMDDDFYKITGTSAFGPQAARFIRSNLDLFFLPA